MISFDFEDRPLNFVWCFNFDVKLGDKLGEGRFGSVYAGNYHDTPAAIKIISFDLSEYDKFDFEEEIELVKRLSDLGVGPKYYDSKVCGDYGVIITELYPFNLTGYLEEKEANSELISQKLQQMVEKLINNGIFIWDLHGDNVVIDPRPPFRVAIIDPYLPESLSLEPPPRLTIDKMRKFAKTLQT